MALGSSGTKWRMMAAAPRHIGAPRPRHRRTIDTTTNTEARRLADRTAQRCLSPRDIAITPDGTRAYIANESQRQRLGGRHRHRRRARPARRSCCRRSQVGATPIPTRDRDQPRRQARLRRRPALACVYVIDTQTNAADRPADRPQTRLRLSVPDRDRDQPRRQARLRHRRENDEVIVVDTQTNSVAGQPIKIGILRPSAIAISPDGTRAYVANQGAADPRANTVAVIDTQTNQLLTSIPVGKTPAALAITPDGARVYVANEDEPRHLGDRHQDQPAAAGDPDRPGRGLQPRHPRDHPRPGPVASFSVPARLRLGAPFTPTPPPPATPTAPSRPSTGTSATAPRPPAKPPSTAYAAPGTYNIALAVADDEGCSDRPGLHRADRLLQRLRRRQGEPHRKSRAPGGQGLMPGQGQAQGLQDQAAGGDEETPRQGRDQARQGKAASGEVEAPLVASPAGLHRHPRHRQEGTGQRDRQDRPPAAHHGAQAGDPVAGRGVLSGRRGARRRPHRRGRRARRPAPPAAFRRGRGACPSPPSAAPCSDRRSGRRGRRR